MSEFKPGDRVKVKHQTAKRNYRVIGYSCEVPDWLVLEETPYGVGGYTALDPINLEHVKTPKQRALDHVSKYYFGNQDLRPLIEAIEEKEQ